MQSQVGFVSSSISNRQVFAERNRRSRTADRPLEKKAGLVRACATAVRSPLSGYVRYLSPIHSVQYTQN